MWGKGYATEAALAAIHLAKDCGVAQLHAVVNPLNVNSLTVCKRLSVNFINILRILRQYFGAKSIKTETQL